jgi:hypothetical protein
MDTQHLSREAETANNQPQTIGAFEEEQEHDGHHDTEHEPAAAAPLPTRRAEVLASLVVAEEQRRRLNLGLDPPERLPDGRSARAGESGEQKRARLTSEEYCQAAYAGSYLGPGNVQKPHPKPCKHPLPNGLPCHHNLWARGVEELTSHLETMAAKTDRARSQWVFERLHGQWYSEMGNDGCAVGEAHWHLTMFGREVCPELFATVNGLGLSTLYKLMERVTAGRQSAHASLEEGGGESRGKGHARDVDWKTLTVIAWLHAYADTCGDYMPHCRQTIVPRRDRTEEHAEYAAGRDPAQCASYSHFCTVVREAPELRHIVHARYTLPLARPHLPSTTHTPN